MLSSLGPSLLLAFLVPALRGPAPDPFPGSLPDGKSPHSVEPDFLPIPAGELRASRASMDQVTLKVTYRVGPGGIVPGGSVAVTFGYPTGNTTSSYYTEVGGYLLGRGAALRQFPFAEPQVTDPSAPDFVSASCSRPGVELELLATTMQFGTVVIGARVDGSLGEGDEIEFLFGDKSGGSPGLGFRRIEGEPEVVFFVDSTAAGRLELDRGPFPRVRCAPSVVDNLSVSLSMSARPGEGGLLTLTVCQGGDGPYERLIPVESFTGEIELAWVGAGGGALPESVTLGAADRGTLRVPVVFAEEGQVAVRARLAANHAVSSLSNVAVVGGLEHDYAAGDNHRHSAEGGHAAGPAERIWQAQYNSGDDYATVLQHVAFVGADWAYSDDRARRFQERVDPGESHFVAFPGYEWSLPGSHYHVAFRSFGDRRVYAPRPADGDSTLRPAVKDSVDELLDALRKDGGAIAIPHHSKWMDSGDVPFDWGTRHRDPARPVVEIYSNHGASDRDYELPPAAGEFPVHWDGSESEQRPSAHGGAVAGALERGWRMSFVGGSDNHGWARGPSPTGGKRLPVRTSRGGLGVVLGDPAITGLRQRIFGALEAGRTYATTGHKSVASFAIGDAVMGEETTVPRGTPLRVFAVASGVARPDRARFVRVRVLRDGTHEVLDRKLDAETLELTWADPSAPRDGAPHAYHVELSHDDFHATWLSPIWVTYAD